MTKLDRFWENFSIVAWAVFMSAGAAAAVGAAIWVVHWGVSSWGIG